MIKPLSVILLFFVIVASIASLRHARSALRSTPSNIRATFITWMFLILGSGVFFQRHDNFKAAGGLDISAKMQIASYFIAGLLVLWLMSRTRIGNTISRLPNFSLMLYALLGLISATYSPAPFLTAYKASVLVLDVFAIAISVSFARKYSNNTFVINGAIFACILFTLGAFLGVLIRPEEALRTLGAGGMFGFILDGTFPYINGNELGFLSAVIALVSISRFFDGQPRSPKLFLVSIALVGLSGMVFAQARTAIVGFVIGLVILSIGQPKIRKYAALGALLATLAMGYLSMVSNNVHISGTVKDYLAKGQADEGLQSLEGRFNTWVNVGGKMILDAPVLGHGFDAGVRYGGTKYGIGHTHMHNSHIQILANSGILGYIPWFLVIMWTFITFTKRISILHRKRRQSISARPYELYAILIMLLLRTMTGSVMVNHGVTLIMLIGIIVYLLSGGALVKAREQPCKTDTNALANHSFHTR